MTKAFTEGNVSASDLMTTLGNGTGTLAKFGGAAATASGTSGLGAVAATLGPLTPALLGIVGAGGVLALGYGAWKEFGEEAWNSSQRVAQWGTDVGTATDEALGKVKDNAHAATGEFSLLEQGISGNTESIVNNFSKMGESIETNMIKKIDALREAVQMMPEDVRKVSEELTEEEIQNQEKYLEVVKENNEKITAIREGASKANRKLTYGDTVRIKALAEESATVYVESLGKSEKETKQILSAMTGNVETATKEQAISWIQSLGKQRQASKVEYTKMREDLIKHYEKTGLDVESEFVQKQLALLEKSSQSATQITEDRSTQSPGIFPIHFSYGVRDTSENSGRVTGRGFFIGNREVFTERILFSLLFFLS